MLPVPFRLTLVATAAVAAAFFASFAHGQEAGAGVKTAPPKVEIKAAADAYDARRDDTAARIVVTNADIIKYGDTNLLDVFKRLPGVTVAGGQGRGGEIRMRGLGSGYTQILIDGERAPTGFSIDTLAPSAIERIEIMRAATAEFSTQAIAGTINIVLKKTIRTAQRDLKLGLNGGDGFLVRPNANLQLSDKSERMSWSLGVNASTSRGAQPTLMTETETIAAGEVLWQRERSAVQHMRNHDLSITPRINWTLDSGATLSSQTWLSVGDSHRLTDDPITIASGVQPQYAFVRSGEDRRTRYLKTDLNWVRQLPSGLKLDLRANAYGLRQSNFTRVEGYAPIDGPLTLDDQVSAPVSEVGMATIGKISQKFGDRHALVGGWDGGVTTARDQRAQDVYLGPAPSLNEPFEQFRAQVRRLAVYAQDEWTVTPSWSVYMGVRWEGARTEASGTGIAPFESDSGVWTPLFQSLYKIPDTRDQFRVAVTRTYKAPGTFRLIPRVHRTANNSRTDFDAQGNPELLPETALGLDVAYEHFRADGAMLAISASSREIDDYTRNDVMFIDGRSVFLPINDGKAQTRGLELELKFPLKAVMKDAMPIDLRASLARNWSSVDAVQGPDNRVGSQVPFSANIGADYSGTTFSGGASFAFRSIGRVRISEQLSTWGKPRRDLDAYLLWKFAPRDQLRFSVNNLLGQDFHTERVYTDAAGSARRVWRSPASPTFRLTLELKY
jgi:outer membrane receptor for ferrienterochelin and colicins